MKKNLFLIFFFVLYANISNSSEFKNKVLGLANPDFKIVCYNYKTKEINWLGFNEIKDEILGEFTTVHQIIDNVVSPFDAIVYRDQPEFISWNDFTYDSIGWYAFNEKKMSDKDFSMISEIYLLENKDDAFVEDIKLRVAKSRDVLEGKDFNALDDIDIREYFINVLGIVKKVREQESKILNDKTYKKIEDKYLCKVG